MERPRGPSQRNERPASPAEGMQEFLKAYNEIMLLIGYIVECGPGLDPYVLAMERDQLDSLLRGISLDPDDPSSMDTLTECYVDVMARARNPQPSLNIPDVGFFEERIRGIIRTRSSENNTSIGGYHPTISEVAGYVWTDWAAVQSRSGDTSTPQYIHDIAEIVADPMAYSLVFPEREDDIGVTPTWEVANGRHRSLAVVCLGSTAVKDANNWVVVEAVE